MALLKAITYNNLRYPADIPSEIKEVAGHFDISSITIEGMFSLHTEYSYGPRKFNSDIIDNFSVIKSSQRKSVPQLWFDDAWSSEFVNFIRTLLQGRIPEIIEIHPPFNDYCGSINEFVNRYSIFEKTINIYYPDTNIFSENRAGSIYSGGKFLISTIDDLAEMVSAIKRYGLKLRIVLDIPQLLTAHKVNLNSIDEKQVFDILTTVKEIRDYINGIHIWGKKKSDSGRWVAHAGDLNSLFSFNYDMKNIFLEQLYTIFSDTMTRFFVPEVNSGQEDLTSIINDFTEHGFKFI